MGEKAGEPFKLEPFQQAYIWNSFGWMKKATGKRRFTKDYYEVGKKNAKTTLAAYLGVYGLDFDGEGRAQIYSAATKRDQAKICLNMAREIVKAAPTLTNEAGLTVYEHTIWKGGSFFKALSADHKKEDGFNPHFTIVDELHVWENGDLLNLIEDSTATRAQPKTIIITTGGTETISVWYEQRSYAIKVLEGVVQDDNLCAWIYALDPYDKEKNTGDDPDDEANWIKANPLLGVRGGKKLEFMRKRYKEAKEIPSQWRAFKRYHLNLITGGDEKWVTPEDWAKCGENPTKESEWFGRNVVVAIDVSAVNDFTTATVGWIDDDEIPCTYTYIWIPQRSLKKNNATRPQIEAWIDNKFAEATESEAVDIDVIIQKVVWIGSKANLCELTRDPWNAMSLDNACEKEGIEVTDHRQGYASMNAPMKATEKLVISGKMRHENNPVVNWMISNVVVSTDPAGNEKPDKGKSREKIDGALTNIMAIGRICLGDVLDDYSPYQDRGVVSL